ncbi:MAG: SMI1/KNR4 family protein [Desulfobacteraceae bacterium]|nr:SMI1/KNR4 family protein [Desulfobacteraceae bacterium]
MKVTEVSEWIIELFNLSTNSHINIGLKTNPTNASVDKINNELNIKIPGSFIDFAKRCPSYSSWLASIGEDYTSHNHILRLNKLIHRQCNVNTWLPSWLIMINHGYDGDCDCFDTRSSDLSTGEYSILHWDDEAGKEFEPDEPYKNFHEYIESYVLSWAQRHYDNKNRSGRLRRDSREIVSHIDAVLKKI